jgi:hypothetical protein
MAKLINSTNLSATITNNYRDQVLNSYSRYFNQIPLGVDYFSIDLLDSVRDVSLHTVEEIVGIDSPLKFNKIENFPLYKLQKSDGDLGVGTEGEALVIPDTIKPKVDDLLIITENGLRNLYRVNDVLREQYYGKSFFRIVFSLHNETATEEDINRQVSDNFDMVSSGSSDTVELVLTSDSEKIKVLTAFLDQLREHYSFFYDRRCGHFVFFDSVSNIIIIDWSTNYFLQEYLVMSNNKAYRNELFLERTPLNPLVKDNVFKQSIFNLVLTKDKNRLNYKYAIHANLPMNFALGLRHYNVQKCTLNYVEHQVAHISFLLNGNLKEYIEIEGDDTAFVLDSFQKPIAKVIKRYIKGELTLTNLIDDIAAIDFGLSLHDYLSIPCILYIIKQLLIIKKQ